MTRKRLLPVLLGGTSLLLLAAPKALAALTLNLNSATPQPITSLDQEITVDLSVTDLPSGVSYFRAAFQKAPSGNFFGYVKNNLGNWAPIEPITSPNCANYFSVTGPADSLNLSLIIKAGVENTIDPNSTYQIKAHRLTSTCASSTVSGNSLPATFDLEGSTPTPTPTPVPTISPPPPTPEPTPPPPTPTTAPTPTDPPPPQTPIPPSPTAHPSPSPHPTPTPMPTPAPTGAPPPPRAISTPFVTCILSYRPVTILGVNFYFPKLSCTR